MKGQHVDLTFVGAGLSCCCTTIYYINLAYELKKKNKVKVLIIERTGEFWTGIPYGMRSGFDSLIITSLKEFLPENELKLFVDWLKENFHKVVNDQVEEKGANPINEWLLNNEKQIRANLWENLFIPRYFFGIYLKDRVTGLLERAEKDGIIDYQLLTADVIDIERNGDSYNIRAKTDFEPEMLFSSTKVILSVGTPPKARLNINLNNKKNDTVCVIEDIYEPNIIENINQIRKVLGDSDPRQQNNILILGSNASALEVLYNLKDATTSDLINQFYILSPDGAFPNKIKEASSIKNYIPVNLNHLKNAKSYTSGQIVEAARKDTMDAHEEKIDISDIYHPMSDLVIDLLNKLDIDEQKKFVFRDGVEIGKFQRRAGAEYLEAVGSLISQDKMSVIKGRFLRQVFAGPGSFYFEYMDKLSGEIKTFPLPVKIVINCIGFQNLSGSPSFLINRLIERNICLPNASGRGFEVNENFEAKDNFYIMGPLLAGNLNERLRVWHAESCPRIFHLSGQLAAVLIGNNPGN
ncbi:MAG: FAD/NAD(P)-binding protein [Ferruginibacter sp.]